MSYVTNSNSVNTMLLQRVKMFVRKGVLHFCIAMIVTSPAYADHPGLDIDNYMQQQEKYFQVIDLPNAPEFELEDVDGNKVRLSDYSEKIVVLNFVFASCVDICPLHSALLADIQRKANIIPMVDDVQFISITTDPENDTASILKAYGKQHGFDDRNWTFLTAPSGTHDDVTRQLSDEYNVQFTKQPDGQFVHGAVIHIIDRKGRFAAKFHGLDIAPVNVVLYLNGLIDNWYTHKETLSSNWWGKLKGFITEIF